MNNKNAFNSSDKCDGKLTWSRYEESEIDNKKPCERNKNGGGNKQWDLKMNFIVMEFVIKAIFHINTTLNSIIIFVIPENAERDSPTPTQMW